MNLKEYKDSLLKFDLKSFLESYGEKDLLRLRKLYPELYKILAEQVMLYPKARVKLPIFAENFCFFTRKSYEQSSSQILAEYKAKIFSGRKIIDLSGGLGVDDWAFSKSFNEVISIDKDIELNVLARLNFEKLKTKNIERIDSEAENFIRNDLNADLIYIDADRRTKSKRSVTLEESEPNIIKMLPRLLEISENVLLKLSPLIDISYLVKRFPNAQKISVISLDNEVKEILIQINRSAGKAEIKAINISKKETKIYSAQFGETATPQIEENGKYFYEPSASLIKAGLVNAYAESNRLNKISINTSYFTGDIKVTSFFGRTFRIVEKFLFSKSKILVYLKEKNISEGNISKRNFLLTTEELRKLTKLKDGGQDYFFFTTNDNKQKLVYHCRKL